MIEIDQDKVQIITYTINKPLKGFSNISETKRHATKLIQTKWGVNCRFCDVVLGNREHVVGAHPVDLGKDGFTGQLEAISWLCGMG